ncbi:MAG: right-handed parallel beta-helix repeat-containing protein [Thermoanaerobaculia bacterium]|nr:right-handed parallel beta-helix repeat-containing protein [Thermoanaerobaculia bacterium]
MTRTLLAVPSMLVAMCLVSGALIPLRAAEYFVSPSGNDANPGTLAAPFQTFHRGMEVLGVADTLTVRQGVYRLMDEDSSVKHITLILPGATEGAFPTIRGFPGEQAKILGSIHSAGQTWESVAGGLWRLPANFLVNDPKGMWNGERRVRHRMEFRNNLRSHAPTSALTDPGDWTKADASGQGCDEDNSGCFIYMRPVAQEIPSTEIYEFSQRAVFLAIGVSHLELEGLEFAYTQGTGVYLEGGDGQIVRNNWFCHHANGHENSIPIFISGGGALVEGNEVCDSAYWGGVPNSRGITFMFTDPDNPPTVRNNLLYDIGGPAIGSKGGAAKVLVERNVIRNSGIGVEGGHTRCQPDCVSGEAWIIRENLLIDNRRGISPQVSPSGGEQIYNNVFWENDIAIWMRFEHNDWSMLNNIFAGNERVIFVDNESGDSIDMKAALAVFASDNNLFFENLHDYFLRPDWFGGDEHGTGFSVAQMQASYGREMNSLGGQDPAFLDPAGEDFRLRQGSPAIGHGDGTPYGLPAVDLGAFPLGSLLFGDGFESGNTSQWSASVGE